MRKNNPLYSPTHWTGIVITLLMFGCSEPTPPEQQVREYVEHVVSAVENRKPGQFKDLIDDTYQDSRGHDKTALSRVALAYLLGNNNINIFTQIEAIHFPTPEQADVRLYAGMTATPVHDLGSFLNLRAELFEFELRLIRRDDEWLLNSARWKRVYEQDAGKR